MTKKHPGRHIIQYDIAGLFKSAYTRAYISQKAVKGFRRCGVFPYNLHVFQDADFVSAFVMENLLYLRIQPSDTMSNKVSQPQLYEDIKVNHFYLSDLSLSVATRVDIISRRLLLCYHRQYHQLIYNTSTA